MKQFRKITADANLPQIRLHDLRHTAATLYLGNTDDVLTVSRMLGHANIGITLDMYGHVLKRKQQQHAATINAVFS